MLFLGRRTGVWGICCLRKTCHSTGQLIAMCLLWYSSDFSEVRATYMRKKISRDDILKQDKNGLWNHAIMVMGKGRWDRAYHLGHFSLEFFKMYFLCLTSDEVKMLGLEKRGTSWDLSAGVNYIKATVKRRDLTCSAGPQWFTFNRVSRCLYMWSASVWLIVMSFSCWLTSCGALDPSEMVHR